jgi:hypothetical protein
VKARLLWVDTKADEEARALDRGMWEVVGQQEPDGSFVAQATGPAPENGEFWADALDRIKDDPDQRYAMARRHLPLPAAWREMAIALRTKIRKARKGALRKHIGTDLLANLNDYIRGDIVPPGRGENGFRIGRLVKAVSLFPIRTEEGKNPLHSFLVVDQVDLLDPLFR